ncbi:MAG: DUF3179 domain-containing (seleno)protein [Bacteroidota bacterium]
MAQQNPKKLQVDWKTDTSIHAVPLNEFTVLLKPDGIPPIDSPKFWEKEKAKANYFEHDPVVANDIKGKLKAYPLSVLMFHEIVNDELNGVPFAATYCPLCNAALVFERRLTFNGEDYLLDFGRVKFMKTDLFSFCLPHRAPEIILYPLSMQIGL